MVRYDSRLYVIYTKNEGFRREDDVVRAEILLF